VNPYWYLFDSLLSFLLEYAGARGDGLRRHPLPSADEEACADSTKRTNNPIFGFRINPVFLLLCRTECVRLHFRRRRRSLHADVGPQEHRTLGAVMYPDDLRKPMIIFNRLKSSYDVLEHRASNSS
jgi:hypothetical protein